MRGPPGGCWITEHIDLSVVTVSNATARLDHIFQKMTEFLSSVFMNVEEREGRPARVSTFFKLINLIKSSSVSC